MIPSDSPSAIVAHLLERIRHEPDRTAIVDRQRGKTLSFSELGERLGQTAQALLGLTGTVALSVSNAELCPWFFGARHAGLTVALMDAQLSADEKRQHCRRMGIAHLIHQGPTVPESKLQDSGAEGAVVIEAVDGVESPLEAPPEVEIVKLTSGSTGAPTGACFSERELILGVGQIGRGMELTSRDRVLMLLPMTHSYGFDNGVLSLGLLGTPLTLDRRILPGDVIRAAVEDDVTVLPLVPPLVRVLGQAQWPEKTSLRRVICAGGCLPPEFARAFHRASGVPVHNFFGSSETGGITFESRPQESAALGTVGFPMPGVQIELDEKGEVSVVSAAVSKVKWTSDGFLPMDDAISTGDVGEWTPEGRLRLVGRTADRLNIGGRKVAAAEIEGALRGVPFVIDAAVVGIADEMRGDRVAAFLVTEQWPVDLSSVAPRWRPRETYRVESLPMTVRGKVDRAGLRDALQRQDDLVVESLSD